MTKREFHVGEGFDKIAARVTDVWERAERGETVAPQDHFVFENYETLLKVLTPKRFALLRRLHAHPAASVAALARDLGRDYKRVHEDVEALTTAGLIERDGGLTAPYDAIEARMAM